MTKPTSTASMLLPMTTSMLAEPSPCHDQAKAAERAGGRVQLIAGSRALPAVRDQLTEYESTAASAGDRESNSLRLPLGETAALQESDTALDGGSATGGAVGASRPSGQPAVRQAVKPSRFWAAEPCQCCSGRVPRNRSWRSAVCTPSCWAALTPDERSRLVPETTPCLVCQDRLAERRRTSSHVRARVGGDGGRAGTLPGVGGLGPRVGTVRALSGEAA